MDWSEGGILRHRCLSPGAGICQRYLNDPIWDDYRDLVLPYGIRAVWSQPLFARDGKVLGTFAILYREVRTPSIDDCQLIENAGHIAGIAIERQLNEEKLRPERDRLRLLLEITNSMTSKLDFRHCHFALEDSSDFVAERMKQFLSKSQMPSQAPART